ncbi:MAG: 3-isopropylmalate dehydratase large subunit [Vicinamibacterales bacterium]
MPSEPTAPRTLVDKIWDRHTVARLENGETLLYVDLHLVHEVTSPQAFEGLARAGRGVRRPERTVATLDHNIPTRNRHLPLADPLAAAQVAALRDNCRRHGVVLHDLDSPHQGIVHVIGPELGLTRPGMTVVCGDSHTSTHGAFGAYAVGIGTSDVEHVLATQCLIATRPKTMAVRLVGERPAGVAAKDIALAFIGAVGVAGGTGHVLEFTGPAVAAMTMDERMTLCNMSIEAGARAGLVAPDHTTIQFLRGRPAAPAGSRWMAAVIDWWTLRTDPDARFDREVVVDVSALTPRVTWGTRPDMVTGIEGTVPDPAAFASEAARRAAERALDYMALEPGRPIREIPVDRVFIGSCTNARLSDLRDAARIARGRRVAAGVHAMVVPGSVQVRAAAEAEGLDRIFREAGFDWREPGCSMCLGMNEDVLAPGERCASTSNRNFEGRQGRGGRTHLVSPAMAAAAALAGHFDDARRWLAH